MWRAAVLVLLGACGDGITMPDAPVHPGDGDLGLVRVQYRGGVPEGNVVLFQDADGALVLATRTDGDGRANAYMHAGGTATIIGTNGNSHLMYTWTGVQPGDELVLDRRAFSDLSVRTIYQVTMPVAPAPDADLYQLLTACGSFAIPPFDVEPQVVVDLRGCDQRTDMLVLAGPTFNGTSYLHAADVGLASVDIRVEGDYHPFDTAVVNVQGATEDTASAVVLQYLIAQGQPLYRAPPKSLSLRDGLGQMIHGMPLPGTSTLMTAVYFDVGDHVSTPVVTTWGPAKTTTPIDVSATQLRRYTNRGSYDPNQQRVEWGEDTTGALGDAVLVQVGWFRPGIGENYQWQVLARRGAEPTVQLPQLPGGDFTPREGDTIIPPSIIANIKLDGGYDRVRTSLLGRWLPGDPWPAETAAGSVVYEAISSSF